MIVRTTLTVAALATALLAGQEPVAGTDKAQVKTEAPRYMGWAFLLRPDLEAGRRAGTLGADVPDAEALEAVASALRARLVGSGKFVEGQVAIEDDQRLSVTFVGRLGSAYEELIQAGLCDPGRLELYALAPATDELAVEQERFLAWRAAHPGAPASEFDAVPSELGGPRAGLRWRPGLVEGEPFALEASTFRLMRRSDAGGNFLVLSGEQGPEGFQFECSEEGRPALAEYLHAHAGQALAVVLNGVVRSTFVPGQEGVEWDGVLRVEQGLDLARIRSFFFGFAGEPLAVPLAFDGFAKRPLLNVRTDGEDPEVVPIPAPK